MSEIILDSVIDSIKLLPFLFLTYLFMEWLEHKTGAAARKRIRTAGKFGPVWGGLLGVIPQCGFSAAASSLFAGRVITVGTLIAVYLSTSDEMFPIMISNAVPVVTIVKIRLYPQIRFSRSFIRNTSRMAAVPSLHLRLKVMRRRQRTSLIIWNCSHCLPM